MVTIKSYTDLEQSKKLVDILPLESADYFHAPDVNIVITSSYITDCCGERCIPGYHGAVPCWSLASLLNVLPKFTIDSSDDHYFRIHCQQKFSEWHDNLIDACYEMIIRLHELKKL